MEQEQLIIKNICLGRPRKTLVDEENLAFFAPATLDDFYRYNHTMLMEALGIDPNSDNVTRMMAVLPHIAKYYGIDRNALLTQWAADYGIVHMMRDTASDK